MVDQHRAGDAEEFGTSALYFVEKIAALSTVSEVYEAFDQQMSRDFGFEHFIMVDVPSKQTEHLPRVMMSKAPIGWTEQYLTRGYQRIDPVLHQCRVASQPFEWADLRSPQSQPAQSAQEFMARANDFGLVTGLTVPIHNFDGTTSCVSLSAASALINLVTRPAIHLMAIYAFEQVRRLMLADKEVEPSLTPREIEVLTWAATGKSAAAIGDILRISERTAIAHTINATHKLGASNKTHAVAIAMKRRLIAI